MDSGETNRILSDTANVEIDRRQIDAVFRAEGPRLARMLRSRLRGTEDSTDLLQEAFARFIGSWRGNRFRNPEAYLQRIVRNLLIDRGRSARSAPVHLPISDDMEFSTPPEQAYAIEVSQMREQYRAIVAALPPRTREVFLLHRVEEISYAEIAERLNISVRTVEWHISQALAQLGKGLDR